MEISEEPEIKAKPAEVLNPEGKQKVHAEIALHAILGHLTSTTMKMEGIL